MLTFKAEVLKAGLKKDGTYNVKIRVTYNREVKRLSTSIFVRTEDLSKSFKIKNPDFYKKADKIVRDYQEMSSKLPLDLKSHTLDDILSFIDGENRKKQQIDFIQFSKKWIHEATIKGVENYTSAINAFILFLGKEELNINQITIGLLGRFTDYLEEKRKERIKRMEKAGERIPSNRMLSLYLGSIRHLYNEARKQFNDYDRNIIMISGSPFENFKIPKQEATRKRAISPSKIRQIFNLPYHYNNKGREIQGRYNLAKDCFILSFCLIGMNSTDLYSCSDIQDYTITYYRNKTKERRNDKAKMKLVIPDIIKPLLKKYGSSSI